MFVALKIKDGTRVTSIASQWDAAEEELRAMAAAGEVVCLGCKQALWLRSGTRRRHFAHRKLADCPLENESPELREAKALLYDWLETKFPGKVNIDVPLGIDPHHRYLDLLVEANPDRKFGYWVFDRQQRHRDLLLASGSVEGLIPHFIHTSSIKVPGDDPYTLLLSASLRDFMQISDYDSAVGGGMGHLHFINPEESTIIVFRGLWCIHRPNVFRYARCHTGKFTSALISPKTGEILFPEDVEARRKWREKQIPPSPPEHRPQAVTLPAPAEITQNSAELKTPDPTVLESAAGAPIPELPAFNLDGPFKCEICGTVTEDWSQAVPSQGTCICRSCIYKSS